MKKLLAILLSVTMLLGCIVVSVSATGSDEKVATIEFGEKYELNALEYATLVEDDWNPTYTWTTPEGLNLLCNFLAGDYVEYKINVLEAETYDFSVFFACMWEDSYFTFYVDGVEAGTVNHYASKFIDLDHPVWTDPAQIELTEGEHTIKLTFASGCQLWGIGINSGEEEPEAPETDAPVEPEEPSIEIALGEKYELNAVENATLYEDGWQPGEVSDINGVPVYVNFGGGDYIEYKINVLEAGTYDFTIVYSAMWEGNTFTICVDDVVAGTVNNDITKFVDLNTPIWTDPVQIELTEGEHTIKVSFTSMSFFWGIEIDSETETPVEPEEPATGYEVAVDNQGKAVDHGFTITSGLNIHIDYQFKANAGFDAFSVELGFFSASKTVSVSLYKFNTDRATTLAGEAIQTWSRTGNAEIGDYDSTGVWESFELAEALPAGDYIVEIAPPTDTTTADVIWKKYDVEDTNGIWNTTFKGEGFILGCTPTFKVNFIEEVADGNYFGKVTRPVYGTNGENLVYPETVFDLVAGTNNVINAVDYGSVSDNNLAAPDEGTLTEGVASTGDKMYQDFRYLDDIGFKINAPVAGTYSFAVNHVWGGNSVWEISIDGATPTTVMFHTSDPGWTAPAIEELGAFDLTAGEHTVRLTCIQAGSGNHIISLNVTAPEAYVYVNSLDGEVIYTGEAALGEVTDAMLAKLNAYANEDYNSFVKFEEVSYKNHVYTFYSVHNTEATVTVEGGAKEEKDGYYVLTAGAPAEGEYFLGWYDGDKLISYNETYKFFPDGATESLVAKYAEEAPAKDSKVEVEADRVADKLTVKVTPVYGDNVIVDFGYYVATSADAMDAAAVIANGKKLDSHAPHAYMVRVHDILETTKLQNIYIVGYFTYNDGEAIQTITTELVKVASVTSLIDSDTYTYSNTNAPAMVCPETVSGIAGFDGNCLYFNDPDYGGTIWGYYPEGNFGMIKYSFEAGRTYLFSFEYKPGDSWTEGFAPYRMTFGNLFYWNGGYNISQQDAAITFENVCIDEENGIYRCTATFVATENGGCIELGQWGDSFEAYMDNIIMEKIA